jgi:ribonuclease HI
MACGTCTLMLHAQTKVTRPGIILISPIGKIHNFSYRLEFACTNNVTKFEPLLLGIENAYNLGYGHLSVFGDSELIVNLVHKVYSPSNKLMK